MMSPQTPEAKLTGGHKAPLHMSAISTRGPDLEPKVHG
jgi:hypothetical protein